MRIHCLHSSGGLALSWASIRPTKNVPGGIGGTSVYWEVEDLNQAVAYLTARGARLYRGPYGTDLGAAVALMVDPFGCTVGLNQSTGESSNLRQKPSE